MLAGWEVAGLLCLDDVQRVIGDDAWELALFGLFQAMTESGGTLVVAADSSPVNSGFRLPDLASRLASGPVYQLKPLGEAERLVALQQRASGRGFELPAETGHWLLRRFPRDLASLFTLLDTLDIASLAAGRRLTIPFVRAELGAAHQVQRATRK